MPFITNSRKTFDAELTALKEKIIDESSSLINPQYPKALAENLTYALYKILKEIYENPNAGWYVKGDVSKILHAVQLQFDQDIMIPYERKKKIENGDV